MATLLAPRLSCCGARLIPSQQATRLAVKEYTEAMSTKSKATPAKTKKTQTAQYVYAFGKQTDGNASMRELLGGKGANLAEMAL